ncbi:MAG: class I SAM-dependent DNA methyltransferase [Elusimicrobiota bacterium]
MSQAYGKAFARVYNQMLSGFSKKAALHIMNFYQNKDIYKSNKNVLDICCGTGQLALEFLKNKYQVTGIDLSPYMIFYARENTREYESKGVVNFLEADASNFNLKREYGLAVSTYDSINHFKNKEYLRGCFNSVYQCIVKNGYFIFDLNTRVGLQNWNGMNIKDTENILLIIRGIFDTDKDEAITRVSGFVKDEDDSYSRFEEIVYNYVYQLAEVKKILQETGWNQVHFALIEDLNKYIENPEKEDRIFVVAKK